MIVSRRSWNKGGPSCQAASNQFVAVSRVFCASSHLQLYVSLCGQQSIKNGGAGSSTVHDLKQCLLRGDVMSDVVSIKRVS